MNLLLISLVIGIVTGLPKTYKEEDDLVTFYLRNRELGDKEIKLTFENLDVVDVNKRIYFLTHGWLAARNTSWVVDATEAYLSTGDYNVVQVDYSDAANQSAEDAVKDSIILGKTFGKLLSNLIDDYSLSPSNIYLVGHSLGAHISGFAGKGVKEYLDVKVGTIKALDPANYSNMVTAPNEEKLTKDDANLLIVIHTAGGAGAVYESYGAVDFFPNGGYLQACEEVAYLCSHTVVTDYFIESIYNQNGFLSTRCESYEVYKSGLCAANKNVTFGTELTADDQGDYYLDTNAEKPYSIQ